MGNLEEDPTTWYLQHFLVIRKVKSTTKMRTVVDAAATINEICLNDTFHEDSKFQRDLSAGVITK